MVDIRPFRAIRYTEKAGDIKNLITQPYDKIDQDMQREYYKNHLITTAASFYLLKRIVMKLCTSVSMNGSTNTS